MSEKIVMPFNDKYEIVCEVEYESIDLGPEMYMYFREIETGYIWQDLALVRKRSDVIGGHIETTNNEATVLVWGSCGNEDYTDRFDIEVFKEEDYENN